MKKIDDFVICKILERYSSECRYLNDVFIDEKVVISNLKISKTFYANKDFYSNVTHFNAVEAQIILNQLSYVSFYYWFKNNISSVGEYEISDFIDLMREKMLITDCHIKFKEQIDLNEEFNVTMTLGRYKKINNLFLAYTHFNFDNNKALGDLKLVFLT